MSKTTTKPAAVAVALASGILLAGSTFAMEPLAQGYLLAAPEAAKAGEGSRGEGKCGEGNAAWPRPTPTRTARSRRPNSTPCTLARRRCSPGWTPTRTGSSTRPSDKASNGAKGAEGKCGVEGKCGEGKCGGDKKTGDKRVHERGSRHRGRIRLRAA